MKSAWLFMPKGLRIRKTPVGKRHPNTHYAWNPAHREVCVWHYEIERIPHRLDDRAVGVMLQFGDSESDLSIVPLLPPQGDVLRAAWFGRFVRQMRAPSIPEAMASVDVARQETRCEPLVLEGKGFVFIFTMQMDYDTHHREPFRWAATSAANPLHMWEALAELPDETA